MINESWQVCMPLKPYARAHEALNKLLATPEYGIEKGYVFSRLNVEQRDRVVYLPWYAASCLPRRLA